MVIIKKIILTIFACFSLFVIAYGIIFIIDYSLIIKYSIEDCLPMHNNAASSSVNERLDEVSALIRYAKIIIAYAIYALSLTIYWFICTQKK